MKGAYPGPLKNSSLSGLNPSIDYNGFGGGKPFFVILSKARNFIILKIQALKIFLYGRNDKKRVFVLSKQNNWRKN